MSRVLKAFLTFTLVTTLASSHQARAATGEEQPPEGAEAKEPDVVYMATPQHVVDLMLSLADVKETDLLYDLGCGDGRIVVTAAQEFGCQAVGIDIDPEMVRASNDNVAAAGVGHLVTIKQEDIFELDLSEADVVMLYLLPELNVKLIPQLQKMKPGSRIVSHDFDMLGVVEPDAVVTCASQGLKGWGHRWDEIYIWETPLQPVASTGTGAQSQKDAAGAPQTAFTPQRVLLTLAGSALFLAACFWVLRRRLA